MTPSRLSSTRKCCPSSRFGRRSCSARRRSVRWRGSCISPAARTPRRRSRRRRGRARPGPRSRRPATKRSVSSTIAGRHGRPRYGTGARYGESVSTSSRSTGTRRAASCSGTALGYVTLPAKLVHQPRSITSSRWSGRAKQCSTTRPAKPRSTSSVSAAGLPRVDHERSCRTPRRARPGPRTRAPARRAALARDRSRGRTRRSRRRSDRGSARRARRAGRPSTARPDAGAARPSCAGRGDGSQSSSASRASSGESPTQRSGRRPRVGRLGDRRVGPFRQALQVRVGVDHAATGGDSTRGNSCAARAVDARLRPAACRSPPTPTRAPPGRPRRPPAAARRCRA